VVVVLVVVVVVVVPGHSLAELTLKLKGNCFLMFLRAFLPICSWNAQLTQVVELHWASLVPWHWQKFFLR